MTGNPARAIATSSVLYSVQPGQIYEWRVFFEDSLSKEELSSGVNFQVIEAQQRDRITADLQNLEKQLRAENKDI